jgi:hypothetical protein
VAGGAIPGLLLRKPGPVPGAQVLVPKIFTTLRAYDRAQFLADLGAGVIAGIVALPPS